MGVEKIIVRDNTIEEIRKVAEKLEGMETNQEKLQTDITQIKEDVKPKAEPI